MKFVFRMISLFLLPIQLMAGGIPVFDTNELAKQLKDSLYLITVIDDLISETTGSPMDEQATNAYRQEVNFLEREIRKYNQINDDVEELSGIDRARSNVFVHQVRNLTNHIRRVKRILALAGSLGARPEAVSSSIKVLEQRRTQEKERLEVALMALDAQEKVFNRRQKIKRERIRKESLEKELSFIRYGEIRTPIKFTKKEILQEDTKKGLW